MIPSPTPSSLLELATGYQRSKILFALVELEVPTLLADGPRPLGELAERLGLDPLAAGRFLSACVGLGLLDREGDRFRNAFDTQRFLVRGTPTYLGDLFGRYDRASSSTAWTHFAQRLRSWRFGETGPLSTEGAFAGAEILGQHRLSLLAGEALGRVLDLSENRCLLDLGGGTGGMSIALCHRFPALRAIVLELPAMVAGARALVRESGLEDRIEVREGDFVEGPLPGGCDAVLVANVLSMFSVATNHALLGRIFASLPAGGTLALSGWMLDDDETGPLVTVLFCLEDILLGAPDVERSAARYAEWLALAGFGEIERVTYFEPASLVVGRKPRAIATTQR